MSKFLIASKTLGMPLFDYKNYDTAQGAKAALTRILRGGKGPYRYESATDWTVVSSEEYERDYVRKRFVKSLLNQNGPDIEIRSDTPACCDPSSETYWSS